MSCLPRAPRSLAALLPRNPGFATAALADLRSRQRGNPARGSALLLVVAATAALSTLAAVLLATALTAYETAALRTDGEQARLLAEAGLSQIGALLASGAVPTRLDSDPQVWTGALPGPPGGFDPLTSGEEPVPDAPPGGGCGYRVVVETVVGPTGMPRWQPRASLAGTPTDDPAPVGTLTDDPGADAEDAMLLVDATATGWCGRGRAVEVARFAVAPRTMAFRLY